MRTRRPQDDLHAVGAEIHRQPSELQALLSSWRHGRAREGSIFVGAGDSYAAALCASHLSNLKTLALDPYVLHESPGITKGRDVYFISVSGRTRANVAAARKIARLCRTSCAITANEESPLASSVDRVMMVPYSGPPRAPGILSFSLSLLMALMLSQRKVYCDFQIVFDESERASRQFKISRGGVTHVLGNGAAYGCSVYAAAKIAELTGGNSHPELLEEFSHVELFSLCKRDSVNVFPLFDSRNLSRRLQESLTGYGYSCVLLDSAGNNEVERLFHSIFLVQLAVHHAAVRKRLGRPHFQSTSELLSTSDKMIY